MLDNRQPCDAGISTRPFALLSFFNFFELKYDKMRVGFWGRFFFRALT